MLNLCANQNRTSMKTTLLVVGRTVEQHFITAINDYVQRTKRYLSFEMEVIPELKNTKSLSMEVQKEKEGELYAGFDDEMTYNEALATVIRMIKPRTSGFIALPYTPPAGGSFLELAEILELTSTKIEEPFKAEIGNYLNWMNGGITKDEAGIIYVSDDMLDTKIRAYEYMRLFYRALFVETQFQDDYPDVTGRLIDQLLRDLGEKFTDVHEDIVI